MIKKLSVFSVLFIIFIFVLSFRVFGNELPSAESIVEGEIANVIPDNVNGEDTGEVLKALSELIFKAIRSSAVPVAKLFALILICALFYVYSDSFSTVSSEKIYFFLSSAAMSASVSGALVTVWSTFSAYMERFNVLINAISAATLSVYTVSGRVTVAAVSAANNQILLQIIFAILNYGLYPVLQICFIFNFIGLINIYFDLSQISGFIRKFFTSSIVIVMTAAGAVISISNISAGASDGMLIRGVKMAAGSFIPIVGNMIGEAARTVAAGIGLLRVSVGHICILSLIFSVFPPIIELMVAKLSLFACGAAAGSLGMKRESVFLRSSGDLINYLIAFIASSATVFAVSLIIFAGAVDPIAV